MSVGCSDGDVGGDLDFDPAVVPGGEKGCAPRDHGGGLEDPRLRHGSCGGGKVVGLSNNDTGGVPGDDPVVVLGDGKGGAAAFNVVGLEAPRPRLDSGCKKSAHLSSPSLPVFKGDIAKKSPRVSERQVPSNRMNINSSVHTGSSRMKKTNCSTPVPLAPSMRDTKSRSNHDSIQFGEFDCGKICIADLPFEFCWPSNG